MKRLPSLLAVLLTSAFLMGCSPEESTSEAPVAPDTESQPAEAAEATPSPEPAQEAAPEPAEPADGPVAPEQLEAAIKEKNPKFTGEVLTQMGPKGIAAVGINDPAIEDISPLAGLPLYVVDLHDCHISDLSALEGMKLGRVDLSNTGVSDISALAECPWRRPTSTRLASQTVHHSPGHR